MHGTNKTICIAGKNRCAIDCLEYLIKNYKNINILALPNKSDKGYDGWQKSFKRFAKQKKISITNLKDLQKQKNLFLFSLEYEKILNIKKFNTKNLFNFHFSLLPKYRGCHTNYFQIKNGEKVSGVTLHKIDSGIDTGDVIDSLKFRISKNSTAYENYDKLLNKSVLLFKKNIKKILNGNYRVKKQNLKKGSYFSRKSVDYKSLINFKEIKHNLATHNQIRSLIFEPFQLPIYNDKKIIKSIFKNKKIRLLYLK